MNNHQPEDQRYTRYADPDILPVKLSVGTMLGILHANMLLEHTEPAASDGDGYRYVTLIINEMQDYRDLPSIQLEYEGGTVFCWSPDADCEYWVFTYGDNSGANGEPATTEPWEAYLPESVRSAIKDIAERHNCHVYPMNL